MFELQDIVITIAICILVAFIITELRSCTIEEHRFYEYSKCLESKVKNPDSDINCEPIWNQN